MAIPDSAARLALTIEERVSIFTAAWITAAADRILGSKEQRRLREICEELDVPAEEAARIGREARQGALRLVVPSRVEARRRMFECVLEMAALDRGIADRELRIAVAVGARLGLGPAELEQSLSRLLALGFPAEAGSPATEPSADAVDTAALLGRLRPAPVPRPWYFNAIALSALFHVVTSLAFVTVWVSPDLLGPGVVRGLLLAIFIELLSSGLSVWIGVWSAASVSGMPLVIGCLALAFVSWMIVSVSIDAKAVWPAAVFLPQVWCQFWAGRQQPGFVTSAVGRYAFVAVVAVACIFLPLPPLGYAGRPVGPGEWEDVATGSPVTYHFLAIGFFYYGIRGAFTLWRLRRAGGGNGGGGGA